MELSLGALALFLGFGGGLIVALRLSRSRPAPSEKTELEVIRDAVRHLEMRLHQALAEVRAQASSPASSESRFLEILLSQQQQLHERLLLCLDPLRAREAKNLELQEVRMQAEIEEVRQARRLREEQARDAMMDAAGDPLAAERRARLRRALRGRGGEQVRPLEQDLQGDEEEDLPERYAAGDPEPGELVSPARPQLDLRWTKPAPRPRQAMGRPAAARGPQTAREVEQALGAAVVVGAEELEERGPEPGAGEEAQDQEPAEPLGATRAAG